MVDPSLNQILTPPSQNTTQPLNQNFHDPSLNHAGEDTGLVNVPPSLNPASDFYLPPGENTEVILVSQVLDGTNYDSWCREMEKAIREKNKIVFLHGSVPIPPIGDLNRPAWERCNTMVSTWLARSVSPAIAESICRFNNSFEAWNDLKVRFSQVDSFKSSDLQNEFYSTIQGSDSVTTAESSVHIGDSSTIQAPALLLTRDIISTIFRFLDVKSFKCRESLPLMATCSRRQQFMGTSVSNLLRPAAHEQ